MYFVKNTGNIVGIFILMNGTEMSMVRPVLPLWQSKISRFCIFFAEFPSPNPEFPSIFPYNFFSHSIVNFVL